MDLQKLEMKCNFSQILQSSKRKIVIHHTYCFDNILQALQDNDLVFFDDCLYSQYVFIKGNLRQLVDKKIHCVLGFSTGIFRKEGLPIYEADCVEFHEKIGNGDQSAFRAYMSTNELKELVGHDNVYVACHGHMHLNLESMKATKLQQMKLFIDDITEAKKHLELLQLKTSIFVYPRAYDLFPLADKIVRDNGFNYIFAGQRSKRMKIEDLLAGNCSNYNGI